MMTFLALCLTSYISIALLLLRAGDFESNPGNGCLSIAHLNIRSIRNKLNYVTDHLSDFDIICFTETHLDGNIANSDLIIDVHESCFYRKDLNSHSGGLLVYGSDKLVSKRRPDLELDSVHAIWVGVKYHTFTFLMCNVYRSPETPVIFWNFFNISIKRALESNPNFIIVGDLNQYLLLANDNQLANIMSLNNLTNVINKPTRITDTLSTLIDPILVPDTVRVLHSDTLYIANHISDHKATFMTISFMAIFKTCSKRKVWNYARADYVRVNTLIANTNREL